MALQSTLRRGVLLLFESLTDGILRWKSAAIMT